MNDYRTTSVAVRGGELAVGVWGPDDAAAPTVLAVHGVTATHRCWPLVAAALPGVRVVAPDLRGRGRSNGLPAPFGLREHAADLLAVINSFDLDRVVVVGHSMGAFAAVALAGLAARRVAALVLVDGGLPLRLPEGVGEVAPEALLGPAAQRLSMVFARRRDYREFWENHPAFAKDWSPMVEQYVDYDLDGAEPELRPSTVAAAVVADSRELYGAPFYLDALAGLRVSVTFLRAPRGLLDEPAALYTPDEAAAATALVPQLDLVEVDDVNHYTIVMGRHGAAAVAGVALNALAAQAAVPGGAGS